MAADYLPKNAADFLAWCQNLLGTIGDSPTTWCLTSDQLTAINTAVSAVATAVGALPGLAAAYHAGVDTQNAAIAAATVLIRPAIVQVQACPSVTDAMRTTARLPIHDTGRSPIPPPATEPIIYLSNGGHTKILVVLHDSGSPDSHSHARPDGVAGIELWVQKNGTPPVDNSTMTSLGDFSKTRFTLTFDPTDVGKTFYFLGRWVNPTGEKGAWSTVVSMVLS